MASTESRLVSTAILAGVTAAVLEFLPALIVQGALGASPAELFQSIASSIEGPDAYDGGLVSCLLGGALLLLVSVGAASLFVLASRRWPALIEHYLLAGIAYGLLCYMVTRFAVFPLFTIARAPVTAWSMVMNSMVMYLVSFGLPIAVVTRLSTLRVRWS
jgi:hypothetical protein